MSRAGLIKTIGALIALVIILVAISSFVFIIPEGEQAIVLQFGQYIKSVQEPGLYFRIPFVQTIERMMNRILIGDAPPTEFVTLDKERLLIDAYTRYQIVDPHLFFRSVRDQHGAALRVNSIAISKLREMIARYNIWDIISVQREYIMVTTAEHVNEITLRDFGIRTIDVRMKRVDLPTGVEEAVFARMRAERERIAMEHRAMGEESAKQIRAEADREVVVILAEAQKQDRMLRGEGEAQATAIYAEAFNQDPEFYNFLRTLEAYESFLINNTTLVLDAESELLRFLETER